MSSPVVGSARIEYSADLSRFAADSVAQIRAATANMVRQFEEGMARITAAASNGGHAAGNAFQNSVVNNVQQTNIQIIQILNNPSAYGAAGRRDGDAFGDGVASGAKEKLTTFGKLAGTALLGVGAAAVAGAGAMAGFGLKSAAALEQTQVAFTSLLGSADLATSQLQELQKFAAATPFEQQDVLNMAQQYYAFADSVGMAKTGVTDYLSAIGDVGAVTGASAQNIQNAGMAIGQIGSSGKVTLENLNQISEAFPGFNAAAAIARAEGRPTADVMADISAGSLDAATGVKDLIAGMKTFPGAAGAMEKQSQTLNGLFSTFTDTIKMSLTTAFQPMIPAVKTTLGQLTPVIGSALSGVAPTIVHFATELMPLLTPLINGIATVLDSVLAAIGPAFAALGPIVQPLASAFSALFTAIQPLLLIIAQLAASVLPPLLSMFEGIFDALQPVFTALQEALQPAFVALNEAMQPLVPLIAQFAGTLGDALVDAVTTLAPFLPDLATAAVNLGLSFVQLITALDPLIPIVVQVLTLFETMQLSFTTALLTSISTLVNSLANSLAPSLAQMAPMLSDLITKFGDRIIPLLLQAAPMVLEVSTQFLTFASKIGQNVIPAIVTLSTTFLTVVGAIIQGAADAFGWVPGVGPKLKTAAANFNTFKDEANTALNAVKDAANIDVTANTAGALQHIQEVQNAIQNVLNMAAGAERASAAAKLDIGVTGGGTAGRAVGGPVTAGVTYLVGEKGPEFFTAPTDGSIIPNGQTMQMLSALRQPAPAVTVTPSGANGGGQVVNNWQITQRPNEDGPAFAKRVSAEMDWGLRDGGYAGVTG